MTTTAQAFARLVGRLGSGNDNSTKEYSELLYELPAILGRGDNAILIDNDDATISRQHVVIDWDPSKTSYTIKCLSKNGIIVDKKKLSKNEDALIDNGSAIRIGTAKLYFTLPFDKKRKSGSPPSDNVERRKRGSAAGLNEISIIPTPEPCSLENVERITYNTMVQECFEAVPKSYDLNQGIMMAWVLQWIEKRYPNTTQGVLQSSVNKGILAALQKLAVRTDVGDHVIVKCMKWKPKSLDEGNSENVPLGAGSDDSFDNQ